MINIKSNKEIELMRNAGNIMKQVFEEVKNNIKPGISTWDLNLVIKKIIESNGATSAEYNYPNFIPGKPSFPGHACISVNDVIVHGVPSKKVILKEGDIVTVDLVIKKDGYHVDAARTYGVGKISKVAQKLITVTENAFFESIKYAKEGYRIGDIYNAVELYVKKNGFDVIREYQGHGIGKQMHEDPGIPNFGKKGVGPRLQKGMTLAIEPMVTEGKRFILDDDVDGWTVRTEDGKLSAHYENTVLITENEPEILTF